MSTATTCTLFFAYFSKVTSCFPRPFEITFKDCCKHVLYRLDALPQCSSAEGIS